MRLLRTVYFLYLSLLPALTFPAIVLHDAQKISGWYNILFFIAAALYLPLVNAHSSFPKKLLPAVITCFLIPAQLLAALWSDGAPSIWSIVAYQFLVELSGLLLGGILMGVFGQTGDTIITIHGKVFTIPSAKQWLSLLILAIPFYAMLRMIGVFVVAQDALSWQSLFLFTAILTAARNKYVAYKADPTADGMENILPMALGFLSLFSLGPFLGAVFGG